MSSYQAQTAAVRDDVAVRWKAIGWAVTLRSLLVRRPDALWRRYLGALPAALVAATLIWGLAILVWKSVHAFDAFTFTEQGFSWQNYAAVFTDPYTRGAFAHSLVLGIVGGILVTAASIPLAYALVRSRSTGVRILLLVISFIPLLTGDVVRGYGWLVILGHDGLLSMITVPLGLGQPNILGTGWAVLLGIVQTGIPFGVLSIVPAVHQLDPVLEEGAQTLGARPSRLWWHVIIPLLRPGIITALALTTALAIGDFPNAAILGQGRFDFAANAVEGAVLGRNNPNAGAALGVVLLLIGILVLAASFAYNVHLSRKAAKARTRRESS